MVKSILGPPSNAGCMPYRKLSAAIGAEVSIDLTRPMDDDDFERIRRLWADECLVIFPGQNMRLTTQTRFAGRFGSIGKTSKGPPPLLEVSNAPDSEIPRILPEGPIDFHSDQSYLEEPSIGTLLYAIDVPKSGGDTVFGNSLLAYDALSPALKRRLAGRRALHVYDYEADPTRRPPQLPANAVCAVHPIFRPHPPTGRISLYVNRLMTWSILDMDPDESRETLEALFAHQEREEFLYRHRWRPGDLALWDNRSCIHARTDFDPRERRRLRRVTIATAK